VAKEILNDNQTITNQQNNQLLIKLQPASLGCVAIINKMIRQT
jgi:hypothetical protein